MYRQSHSSSLASPQLRRSGRSYNSLSSDSSYNILSSDPSFNILSPDTSYNSLSSDPSFNKETEDLPFNFKFSDFYQGREQDSRDATAMESRQTPVYSPPDPQPQETAPVYFTPESPDSLHADR